MQKSMSLIAVMVCVCFLLAVASLSRAAELRKDPAPKVTVPARSLPVPANPETKSLRKPSEMMMAIVEIVSPATGETWYTDETHNVTWKQGMLPNEAKIRIDFVRPDGSTFNLGDNLPNTGKFSWKVSQYAMKEEIHKTWVGTSGVQPVDTNGTLKVSAVLSSTSFAERQLLLALPRIIITSPKAGEIWDVGKNYTVTWAKKGPLPAMTNLILREKTGTNYYEKFLTIDIPNSGTATITVPQNKHFDAYPLVKSVVAVHAGNTPVLYTNGDEVEITVRKVEKIY